MSFVSSLFFKIVITSAMTNFDITNFFVFDFLVNFQ